MKVATTGTGHCPDCGTRLSAEPWASGLCLSCLLELGLTVRPSPDGNVEAEADLPTVSLTTPTFTPGEVLGNRYRIRSALGSGGMGEVFRAFDLKLRVDVALKAVRAGLLADARALGALREEVRTAREVVSPNVCRVFDLVEFDGRELVSMEYVDGMTLAELLREKSPLDLHEAREIASQFLAGLEAIHAAGLVHRDIKPENVMLTRAGRVVVMDFGIARTEARSHRGTISGTPAYMSPEQARGEAIDPRADVFSAGVLLSEMVVPGGVRTFAAREAVWRGVHDEPPRVGDTPWAAVLSKAVARSRDQRYATAAALARALEEITLRTAGDDTQQPYPGLSSFTQQNADYFVGRELEIEEMWKKLRRRHLLALIGPSGAGKSSFVRAGLGSTCPPGWRAVFTSPSDRPFAALAQALAPELSGDVEAVAKLIDFEHPDVAVDIVGRWRRRHEQALLIVDQFEELFTQSPSAVQERFAQLLARLALEADVHVLLSMRDDFLFQCNRLESLAPVFSELTAIGPPTGAALRRALVQPALKCGYRFEDESVVEEMLSEVAGERGALPLVAFAMARLWDRRDRERGLLTREAYDEIGGVGGALARHAEETLDRIGQDRVALVRELFRNLVTAQGTRATLDRSELLSVFQGDAAPDGTQGAPSRRGEAAEVLDALVDARLLTSYEIPADGDNGSHRRIEIVHESLLNAWPRLVRWQTQDQDGAQLRDQLRQAARLWEQRGKPEDLLWTGTSFREYELWRERYSGPLSATEDTFARAMTARALRRRRQRQLGAAAVIIAAVAVALAMSVLWRRSEAARDQALTAARHSEAQQLFALGQVELEQNPTAALAYALASLERHDSAHARRFAVRVLSQGPAAFVLANTDPQWRAIDLQFSNDGRWLAALESDTGIVRVWKSDGSRLRDIPGSGGRGGFAWMGFSADSRSLVVTQSDSVRIFSVPAFTETRRISGSFRWGLVRGQSVITGTFVEPTREGWARRLIKMFPLPDGAPEATLGLWTFRAPGSFDIDTTGESMFGMEGGQLGRLHEIAVRELETGQPRYLLGNEEIRGFLLSRDGARIYAIDKSRILRIWSRARGVVLPGPRVVWPEGSVAGAESVDGRWLASANGDETVSLWDLRGPVRGEPLVLKMGAKASGVAIDPTGSWMVSRDHRTLSVWPLTRRHPHVLRGSKSLRDVAFDPRNGWIAAVGSADADISVWPLRPDLGRDHRTLDVGAPLLVLEASPRGDLLAAATMTGVRLVHLDGRPAERLAGFNSFLIALAFDSAGRRLAAGGGLGGELNAPGEALIRVWNLDTREVQILDARDGKSISGVAFMPDGRLLSSGAAGMRLWDLKTGSWTMLMDEISRAFPSPDGRYVLGIRGAMRPGGLVGTALIYDLQHRKSRDLTTHGGEITAIAWHPAGKHVVTSSRDGVIRVGPLTGEEPHLLLGHEAQIWNVDVEPNGRWIASTGDDGTVRLWPMPEGRPLHALPHETLLERLRSLTNYRVVQDAASASGYRIDFEPFTGWNRKPPSW